MKRLLAIVVLGAIVVSPVLADLREWKERKPVGGTARFDHQFSHTLLTGVPDGHLIGITELEFELRPDKKHPLRDSMVTYVWLTNRPQKELFVLRRGPTSGPGTRLVAKLPDDGISWMTVYPGDTCTLWLEDHENPFVHAWPKQRVRWKGFLMRGGRNWIE